MNNISLTSSMRSNLQSLQNIAKNQNVVQNRLATGLKVSSAIDNPNSFYTAVSLNNRANDLNILLDSMSQGVQTIKTASQSLEIAINMLEQAKAIANQSLDKFENIVAEVNNESELIEALNHGGKGLIVIKSDINMSDNVSLTLKDGQKLVGEKYLTGTGANAKLSFNNIGYSSHGIVANSNTVISDLDIEYTTNWRTSSGKYEVSAIRIDSSQNVLINNVNIDIDSSVDTTSNTHAIFGINAKNSNYQISGYIKINAMGENTRAVLTTTNSRLDILQNSVLDITTTGSGGYGFQSYSNSVVNIYDSNLRINSQRSVGLYAYQNGVFNIYGKSRIDIISGSAAFTSNNTGHLNLKSSEVVMTALTTADIFQNFGSLNVKSGAKIQTKDGLFEAQKDINIANVTNSTSLPIEFIGISGTLHPQNLIAITKDNLDPSKSLGYNSLLGYYNQLIDDSGYKGINLLLSQNLHINFNEKNSSSIDIKGVDASSKSLGLKNAQWKNQKDINDNITELNYAIAQLRDFSSQFGNYYSIVSTRETFTASIINVLTEGADKLTLADMNQESANMLALQTRQQLAVNSLSLASQAAKSVLKLF